jgi:beta-galactosidase
VINHGSSDVTIPAAGRELISGVRVDPTLCVPAGAVRVVREDHIMRDTAS